MNLYENIKARRKELGMSQSELAQLTGYTDRTSISKIEAGKVDLPQSKIRAIAKALNTTEGQLMGSTESEADRKPSLPPNVTPYNTQKLPLLGTIACGAPILAEENISRYIDVVDTIKADFCLECRGESMIGARIHDGDIVCIRMGVEVLNGQIAAVRIDNEATLKRVYVYPDRVVLQAENPAFPPLIYEKEDMNNVEIIGKAVAFISTVR